MKWWRSFDFIFVGLVVSALFLFAQPTEGSTFAHLCSWAAFFAATAAVVSSRFRLAAVSQDVRAVTATIARLRLGEWEQRVRVSGERTTAELARSLDQWAEELSKKLGALAGERNLLERILEAMAEGVLVLDANGRIVLFNHSLREMLLLPTTAIKQPLLDVVRHGDLQALLKHVSQTGEKLADEIEIVGLKPRRLLVQASVLDGEPGSLVAVFVDVTDVRRLETLRRDFVANVSHELRTPVTAVRSATETLRDGALSDPANALRFIDIVERNANRLHTLVEDLLDLSRIESKAFRLHLEPINLPATVAYCFSLVRERGEKKHLQLLAQIEGDELCISGDRRALEQILTNLIDNAVKYCPDHSSISVRAERSGDGVRIAVADTGPGIAEQHLPRLFERFYRVDAGRSRDIGGTGLGLSIAKHLVEAMNGAISVTSTIGQGTTFSFTLPLAASPESQHEQATGSP